MKTSRFALALTAFNLLVLMSVLFRANSAPTLPVAAPILRGRALELVDDQGRVRAELKVLPAQPDFKLADGTKGYPETVQLRLLTSQNGPNMKLGTMEDGAGLVIGGPSGYVQILSRGTNPPFIKIVNKDGREQEIKVP